MSNGQLKAIVERIENVEREIAELSEGRKEIYQEAKSNGFNDKAIRKLIAIRKKKEDAVKEEAEFIEMYAAELGMQGPFVFG